MEMEIQSPYPTGGRKRRNPPVIRYPQFDALHQDITECIEMTVESGEPQCMSLEGVTGAGKSTLVRDYAAAFPRYENGSGYTQVPVFYIRTPSPPVTVKGMAEKMLKALGDPGAHKGSKASMDGRLCHFIEKCGVRLVILDDFHHLYDSGTERVMETVSDWCKVGIKDTGVPHLAVGTVGSVEVILEANDQLSRLFAVRQTLEPFSWDPRNEQAMEEFFGFVQYAETIIGRKLSEETDWAELLYRIHFATDGVVANLMNLLRAGALEARKKGSELVTLSALAKGYDKRLRKHMKGRENPFEADPRTRFVPSGERQPDPKGSTNNRSQPRKEQKEVADDVLKAR
jgi:hypothetical protein